MDTHHLLILTVSLLSIIGVLSRPWRTPEWVWAVAGAGLLVITGGLDGHQALGSIIKGVDVYLFLIGMMILSELARVEGVFDYVASHAAKSAKGSAGRLFFLIYAAGTLVTIFLSNDATAVVLTPAVYAAVKKSGARPRPYLFACALIANAASFVLPISNPANLVVYASHMPALADWLKTFLLPSILSIIATFAVMWFWFRADLKGTVKAAGPPTRLKRSGQIAFGGLGFTILVLLFASAREMDLGAPTLISAVLVLIAVSLSARKFPREELKNVSWSVIPLVGGLFIIVDALNGAGALDAAANLLTWASTLPPMAGKFVGAFGVGLASNLINNLPVGLTSGLAVHDPGVTKIVKDAVLIGVDLGPNLSVTGSLATILWLMALRREGESESSWAFFALGCFAMPIAMAAALIALR